MMKKFSDFCLGFEQQKLLERSLLEGAAADMIAGMDDTDGVITQSELKGVETIVDTLFKQIGMDVAFTKHFYDRVNDKRNGKPITTMELMQLFRKAFHKYGKELSDSSPDIEGVLNDINSKINVPFVLVWDDRNKELDLVAKTVMRKNNFLSMTKKYNLGK